jgi:geranylgeranyl pyrophosphate synthase
MDANGKTFQLSPAVSRLLSDYRDRINRALRKNLTDPNRFTHRVFQAMEYSLFAGGKRLRPILCLLACRLVQGRTIQALPVACALEYIHTYSLIHDDLPALDNDDFRRGRSSCHKKFGEATAILAGDALLTEAFSLLSSPRQLKAVSAEIRLRLIREMALASGLAGMIGGQEADLAGEKKKGFPGLPAGPAPKKNRDPDSRLPGRRRADRRSEPGDVEEAAPFWTANRPGLSDSGRPSQRGRAVPGYR